MGNRANAINLDFSDILSDEELETYLKDALGVDEDNSIGTKSRLKVETQFQILEGRDGWAGEHAGRGGPQRPCLCLWLP
uniref:Uncharacterized protein n=1 Tax=Zea mays TaxID=4577 RepID=A0A804LBV6_MAIZE